MNNLTNEAKTYKTKESFILDMLQKDLLKPDLVFEKLNSGVTKLITLKNKKDIIKLTKELKNLSKQKRPKKLTAKEYAKIWEIAKA